jgi:hypothetical protein
VINNGAELVSASFTIGVSNMKSFEANPQTKQEWSELLAYLYYHWRKAKLPVTHYPPARCKGSLRLDGVIAHRSIGLLA